MQLADKLLALYEQCLNEKHFKIFGQYIYDWLKFDRQNGSLHDLAQGQSINYISEKTYTFNGEKYTNFMYNFFNKKINTKIIMKNNKNMYLEIIKK